MDPDSISLESFAKSFEFEKTARLIDSFEGDQELKKITKYFCKIYLKQQEVVKTLMQEDIMKDL